MTETDANAIKITDSKSEKENNLLVLPPFKFIFYSILIAIGIWIAESILNLLMRKALEYMSTSQQFIITFLVLFSLSIFIAGAIYKIRKTWLLLTLSTISLVLIRSLYAYKFFDINIIGSIVIYTLGEALVVFLISLAFILLFRIADGKFKFAKLRDIKCDVDDANSKTKYDTGVCCNCESVTKIAKKNSFIEFLPKKEFHFCDNCGIFLRNNPLSSIFFGLAEITLSSCFIVGMVANLDTQEQSTMQNFGLLFFLCAVLDGLRRAFSGIRGIFKIKRQE